MNKNRVMGATLLLVAAAALTAYAARGLPPRRQNRLVVERTVLPTPSPRPLQLPGLVTMDGGRFGPERLRGKWTLVFFGYTACPDVCPTTLVTMSAVARRPESGVSDGHLQLLFVSIEPHGDTPARLRTYLANFDSHIIGLTGDADSVAQFTSVVGASATGSGTSIDHSTSLFVIDSLGRLAGVLLRPSDPARIVADVASLRQHDVR